MNHIINLYKRPHYVILTLEPGQKANTIYSANLIEHRQYYRQLSLLGTVVAYGTAMNKNEITIILSVALDCELEQIITNDPALTSGLLIIRQIIPFIKDKLTGTNEETVTVTNYNR